MIDKLNPNLAQGTEADTGTTGLIPPKAEQRLKDEATTQASAVADEAKAEIGKLADKAKGMAAEQKEFVAGQIGSVADAVQKVAGELEANDATTAGYARTIADTVTSFSDTVKNKDVDELLSMAEDFGKKQPVAFMGAAALLGFAASRFLLASANRRQPTPGMSSQYGSTGVGDGGPAATSYGTSSTSPRDTMGGTI
jgi:hypothetical protein